VRILGIDPGLTRCGVSILEVEVGTTRKKNVLFCKALTTDKRLPQPARLTYLFDKISGIIDEFQPGIVAIERPFLTTHNPDTGMGTAQVVGLVMVLAQKSKMKIALYTPAEVKLAVTGNGAADKLQIQKAMQRLLKLPDLPKPADAADSLAIALTSVLKPNLDIRLKTFQGGKQGGKGGMTPAQALWAKTLASKNKNGRPM
jgi:crossover junction endodeoxyribonuclease RuvC